MLPVALLIVGANGTIAILLPYTAECFPLLVRARATGWVAACTKAGGLFAQTLSITAWVPSLGAAAALTLIPATIGLGLVAWLGRETLGADLRHIDGAFAGT